MQPSYLTPLYCSPEVGPQLAHRARLSIFTMAPNFFKNRRVYLLATVAYMGSLLFGLFTPPLPEIPLLTNHA